ncbi:MAG: hypothetical protein NTU41_04455 [Chloroflexi bacterium]|nr:hypothetical protein [Chloroflexota bacterium]
MKKGKRPRRIPGVAAEASIEKEELPAEVRAEPGKREKKVQ